MMRVYDTAALFFLFFYGSPSLIMCPVTSVYANVSLSFKMLIHLSAYGNR